MTTDIFLPALSQVPLTQWHRSPPTSFKRYLQTHGLPEDRRTPEHISIDFKEQLAPSLREASTMVLRLGKATDGPSTQFTLVSTPGRLDDFFLHDDQIFTTRDPTDFHSATPPEVLQVYTMFGKLTETSMVALAFTSGLMGQALMLDPPHPGWPPPPVPVHTPSRSGSTPPCPTSTNTATARSKSTPPALATAAAGPTSS